uniref:Uncharacterized protein n=2 Tax=Rhizophora mucronata TaxID=61149 RepID=A0A2P2JLP5_RHIMU
MSRCFPYPPPGYEKKGISDDALIESIKVQREAEKAEKERKKEKKREKKEKKQKDKEKVRESGEFESEKHSHKKRKRDKGSQEDQKRGGFQKNGDNEREHSDKSSVTEEQGYPGGSQNSLDSTLKSNKRQKQGTPPDGRHNPGSIIRIRLPSQRHKDPEVLSNKEQPCSALGMSDDASIQWIHEPAHVSGREQEEHPCSTSRSTCQDSTLGLNNEKPFLPSGPSDIFASRAKLDLPTKLCGSCSPHLALKFRNLVENWVPPLMQCEYTDLDNQEWLLESTRPQKENCRLEFCGAGSAGLSHGDTTPYPYPQTCYLPDADIYALPFTVPY